MESLGPGLYRAHDGMGMESRQSQRAGRKRECAPNGTRNGAAGAVVGDGIRPMPEVGDEARQ